VCIVLLHNAITALATATTAAVYAPIQREGRRLDKDAAKYDVLSKAAPVTTVQVQYYYYYYSSQSRQHCASVVCVVISRCQLSLRSLL
jgi:hypothetical protein